MTFNLTIFKFQSFLFLSLHLLFSIFLNHLAFHLFPYIIRQFVSLQLDSIRKWVHVVIFTFNLIIFHISGFIRIMQAEEQKKEQKVEKGIFIAKQRKKGRGGRIKCTTLDNKIEIFDDFELLHESEVEWIEIRRYNKNEKRDKGKNKKQYKKPESQQNTKAKLEQSKKGKTKYVLKPNQEQASENKIQPTSHQSEQKELKQDKENEEKNEKQIQNKEQKLQTKEEKKEEKGEQNVVEVEQMQEGEERKEIEEKKEEEDSESQEEGEKKKEEDMVIVAKVVKQLKNPFWTKPFVSILDFKQKKREKKKYREKQQKDLSQVRIIMKDYFFDLTPIHERLPYAEIDQTEEAQKIFLQYISQNTKIDYKKKSGSVRNQIMDELQSVYVYVQYDRWIDGYLICKLLKIIGKVKTIDGQCNCFLYEHGLDNFQHPPSLKSQNKLEIIPSSLHKKIDRLVFTIDPATSTDLDDALSVEKIDQQTFSVGIHIADVTSYLHLIERQQISSRTTSVYLPHIVYHMLPNQILKICSLDPQVQRLAFTLYVPMNLNGQIVGESILQKSIIKSRYKLSYDTVQSVITGKINYEQFNAIHECTELEFGTLIEKLGNLTRIGLAHRKKRILFEVFENRQLKFTLDENKWPVECLVENRFTAQKIVEEFMIIGNVEAAKKSVQFSPQTSLVIHHPKPSSLSIKHFKDFFSNIDLQLTVNNVLQLQQYLIKVSQLKIEEQIKQLCYFKARRIQETAGYKLYSDIEKQNEKQEIHFALGLQFYAHFTSPMRRMADIVVHEALNKSLTKEEPVPIDEKEVEMINKGRINTKRLKRDLNEIYLCLMVYKKKQRIETDAIVVSYGRKSISLYIPMFQLMKQIMWNDMDIVKAFPNRKDDKILDVCLYYDKKDGRKDVYWNVKKFEKISVFMGCTNDPPLKLAFDFKVKTKKGVKMVRKYRR